METWMSGWNYNIEVSLKETEAVETLLKAIIGKLMDPAWADDLINKIEKLFDEKVSI